MVVKKALKKQVKLFWRTEGHYPRKSLLRFKLWCQSSRERHLHPAALRHAVAFTIDTLLSVKQLPRRSSSRDSVHSAKDSKIEASSCATTSPMPQWAMSRRRRGTRSDSRSETAPTPIGLISTSRTTSVTLLPNCLNALAKSWAPLLEIRLKLSRSWRNVKECCCAIVFVHARMPWSPKLQCLMSSASSTSCRPERLFASMQHKVELPW